jgi:Ca2+-transporting ATPase
MIKLPEKPWAKSREEILDDLDVSVDTGLSAEEVKRRFERYGPNSLILAEKKNAWRILFDQFKSLIVVLLVVAAVVSFSFGEIVEGVAIVVVIVINSAIGFFTELKAVRSMEALKKLGSVNTRVRRENRVIEVQAEEIVPGDIMILEAGDIVTADIRITTASRLMADESSLTGESVPIDKGVEIVPEDVTLAERSNMLFRGSAVTRGSVEGVVVRTGMDTEIGEISLLAVGAEKEATPLEERLDQLGHKLIWITLAVAVVVAISGIISGKELFLMIETSIALAVAAIPEGLPIVATIALARGVWRMAKRNALINRLSAVETLGAADYICTDKTGTLTKNIMTVTKIVFDEGEIDTSGKEFVILGDKGSGKKNGLLEDNVLREILEVGALCNNASLHKHRSNGEGMGVGDPLEVALLSVAAKADIYKEDLADSMPKVLEEAFDSDIKMMATFHKENGLFRVAVKGAPESVIEASSFIKNGSDTVKITDGERDNWFKKSIQMAHEGLRVIALASKETDDVDIEPYGALTFLGLVGMLDPPRSEVPVAINLCRDAGINVVMVTGDQPVTAKNIARAVGLIDEGDVEVVHGKDLKGIDELSESEINRLLKVPIFARVTPKQKLDLIEIIQRNGSIVAMTGDGVNDAPALKKADIGIAMGQRGTQVAREAADMVLKDDSFFTIVAAVQQGRIIFDNIRKFVAYLISCNISEIMIVFLATLVNAPLPILPLQILFLNLVTDVFPALAIGIGEGDPNVMERPPRDPAEPILTRRHWFGIGGYGILMTFSVLGALAISLLWLGMEEREAITVSFLTLAFIQLFHVFNMRDRGSHIFKNEITRNPSIWGSIVLCTGLLIAGVYVPGVSHVLKVTDPKLSGWAVVICMSMIPLIVGQIINSVRKK